MKFRLGWCVFVGLFACATGCEVTERATNTAVQGLTVCPEGVTPDERGDPRNAAGQVRRCWPGEAHCFCDRDNDCYAEEGYVPCAPSGADAGAAKDGGTEGGSAEDHPVADASFEDKHATPDVVADDVATADSGTTEDARSPADVGSEDGGAPDVTTEDVSTPTDVHPEDATPDDVVFIDAEPVEAGFIDAGSDDVAPLDGGSDDVVTLDAGPDDVSVVDAAPDAGSALDAEPQDANAPAPDDVVYTRSLTVRAGRSRQTLTVAGLDRAMTVYLPASRGSAPPLVMLFHGTNGGGDQVFDESGARAMADRHGVVVIAPDSEWISHGDWDHATEETYWITHPDTDPGRNPDLLLVRAIMVEAQRRFAVDPHRVYAIGHSNGGFFTELVAAQLASRIAGSATSSAGLVQCDTTRSCRFQGRGTTCAQLRAQSGWCACDGVDKPGPVPAVTGGRIPPAYLTHGTSDPLVSVQYTCALAERMTAHGAPNEVVLRDGDGHVMPETFASDAWSFLSSRRLP